MAKKIKITTPEYMLKILRQRVYGYDAENDDSHDEELDALSPREKFDHVLGWEFGDPRWSESIFQWLEDAGYKWEEVK